jgi:hypothetical protein
MKPAKNQTDNSLYADGMSGEGYSRTSKSASVQTNKWSGHANDGRLVNKGRGPTKGNQDMKPMNVGPSATKDAYRAAPTSGLPASGKDKDMIKGSSNPQVRTPGGTRPWDPKMGQNYSGNPDQIRIGQSGGPGYGTVGKGKNPQRDNATRDNFNYGPKSQY